MFSKVWIIHLQGNGKKGVAHVVCNDCFENVPDFGNCPLCRAEYSKSVHSKEYTVRYFPEGVEGFRTLESRNNKLILKDPVYENTDSDDNDDAPNDASNDIINVKKTLELYGRKINDLEHKIRQNSETIDRLLPNNRFQHSNSTSPLLTVINELLG